MDETHTKLVPIEEYHSGRTLVRPYLVEEKKCYYQTVTIKGKLYSNTFYWDSPDLSNNFQTQEEAFLAYESWNYSIFKENDELRNEHRELSDGRLEVRLTPFNTIIIDKEDLPLLKKLHYLVNWCEDKITEEKKESLILTFRFERFKEQTGKRPLTCPIIT